MINILMIMIISWCDYNHVFDDNHDDISYHAEHFIGTMSMMLLQAIELLAMKGSAKLIEFRPLRSFDVQLPK